MAETIQNYGTGRRKSATARVFLRPGTGEITVNKRKFEDYFQNETHRMVIRQPLHLTDSVNKFDVLVNVDGGRSCRTGGRGASRDYSRTDGVESGVSEPGSRRPASLPATRERKSERSTARRAHASASSSRRGNRVADQGRLICNLKSESTIHCRSSRLVVPEGRGTRAGEYINQFNSAGGSIGNSNNEGAA